MKLQVEELEKDSNGLEVISEEKRQMGETQQARILYKKYLEEK